MQNSWTAVPLFLMRLGLALFFLLSLPRGGECHAERSVLRVSDRKIISFSRMMDEIKGTQVVVIGENHDNPEHHQLQLDVIDAFHQADRPLVIGLEMFNADNQRQLDRWIAGKLDKPSFIRLYYDNWRMPWSLYSEIFLYARDHGIPLLGLNIEQGIPQKVARRGFGSLTRKELKKVPSGITCDVDAAYMAFIRRAYTTHTRDEKSFVHFCEAQKLWNVAMASRIIGYFEKHVGQTMVVLTGTGHALKRGMPAEIGQSSHLIYKVILPEFPEMARKDVTVNDADYMILE